MIRKHREAECPKISKMKKSDLMKYAEEKGLMKNAPMKEVKEKKPRANKVVHSAPAQTSSSASSMSKSEMLAHIKKIAIEYVKDHPEGKDYETVPIPSPTVGSEEQVKLASELNEEIIFKPAKDEKQRRLQEVMALVAQKIASNHKVKLQQELVMKKNQTVNSENVMKKIEALRVKLSKAKTDSAQMAIEDEIDELKRLLPRKRVIKPSE